MTLMGDPLFSPQKIAFPKDALGILNLNIFLIFARRPPQIGSSSQLFLPDPNLPSVLGWVQN